MNPEQEKKNLKRVLKQTIKMQFPVSMHWFDGSFGTHICDFSYFKENGEQMIQITYRYLYGMFEFIDGKDYSTDMIYSNFKLGMNTYRVIRKLIHRASSNTKIVTMPMYKDI